ncbi:MAG: LacI family DNA-binding transcriptional regulator [Chitinophagaceae bacterium]
MLKKKISIHDIARELKVSATTISFVLNGKAEEKRISQPVKERILAYVKEIGYQPNLVAKSLRTGETRILGMLVEDISVPFFSSIAKLIEANAYKQQYKIFFSSTENDPEKARSLLQTFRERQVDGYIIVPCPGIEENIKQLLQDNYPVVLFDRHCPGIATNTIMVENYKGSYMAVEHFIENDFSQIALVTLDSEQPQMMDRMNGYADAMKAANLTPSILQIPFNTSDAEIPQHIKDFLENNPQIEAVLFATNYLASYGIQATLALNKQIPDDIAIISFDDSPHFSLFSPTITAVVQPIKAISEHVLDKMLSILKEKTINRTTETMVLPVELVVRQSSVKKKVNAEVEA